MLSLLLLACAPHPTSPASAFSGGEDELLTRCRAGDTNICSMLVGALEMDQFGKGRSADAFALAASIPDLDLASQAVLLAEDRRDAISEDQRVSAWRQLCGMGFAPGCEVGARALREAHPEAAAELAATACAGGWTSSCAPFAPPAVELPAPFVTALTEAGAEFWMPPGFHPVEHRSAPFAIASDDGRLTVAYVLGGDAELAAAENREDLMPGLLLTTGANVTQLMPASGLRGTPFPPYLVRLEYNANWGGTGVFLAGPGQVCVIYVHRDPGQGLWMVMTFTDPNVAADLFTAVGHSVRFTKPVGFTGSW